MHMEFVCEEVGTRTGLEGRQITKPDKLSRLRMAC